MSRYDIILADPPWAYANRRLIRQDGKKAKRGIGAASLYPVMTNREICSLPVSEIAAKNAALFLWATWPRIDSALEVMRAWGFKYKTVAIVWVKTCLHAPQKPWFGVGYYTKSNTEPLLLGIRGKMRPICNSVSQVIMEPHPRGEDGKIIHSRKPASVIDAIDLLFEGCMSRLNKLELFATEKARDGWESTGFAVDGLDIRDFIRQKTEGMVP